MTTKNALTVQKDYRKRPVVNAPAGSTFTIGDAKLSAPVVALTTQGSNNLSQN